MDRGIKISVVIAALNCEAVIDQAVCSFISQDYADKELIVIDGASEDHTQERIRRYGAHIAAYLSEKDNGVYEAYNKGVRMATGDYVVFLGADDAFYDKGTLSCVAERLLEEGMPDLLCTPVFYIDRGWLSIEKKTVLYGWQEGIGRGQPMVPHQGMYTKREILLEHPFSMEYRICSDLEFYAFCCSTGRRIVYADRATAFFDRQGISSVNRMERTEEEDRILAGCGVERHSDAAGSSRRRRLREWIIASGWGTMLMLRLRGFRIHRCKNRPCRWCAWNRTVLQGKNSNRKRTATENKQRQKTNSDRKRHAGA